MITVSFFVVEIILPRFLNLFIFCLIFPLSLWKGSTLEPKGALYNSLCPFYLHSWPSSFTRWAPIKLCSDRWFLAVLVGKFYIFWKNFTLFLCPRLPPWCFYFLIFSLFSLNFVIIDHCLSHFSVNLILYHLCWCLRNTVEFWFWFW